MSDKELKKQQEASIPALLNAMLGQLALITFIYFFIFSTSSSEAETSSVVSIVVLTMAVIQVGIGLFLSSKYRAGDKTKAVIAAATYNASHLFIFLYAAIFSNNPDRADIIMVVAAVVIALLNLTTLPRKLNKKA